MKNSNAAPCGETTEKLNSILRVIGGRRSVFRRMSFILVCFFMVMTMLIMLWLNSIVANNHRVQMSRAAIARMESVALTMDQVLADIVQSMEQIMWNHDFVHYMVAPNFYEDNPTLERSRDYRILNHLHSVQENNPLIRQIIFYSPISGQLYRDSTYSVLDAEGTYEWFILQKKETDLNVQLLQKNGEQHTNTLLYNSQGSLFLIQRLDIGNQIGTLVVELDRKGLADLLRAGSQEMVIYPYDSYGNKALKGCIEYPNHEKLPKNVAYITYENVEQRVDGRGETYYSFTSGNTGWQYISAMDMSAFRLGPRAIIAALLPVLLVMLAASVLLAQYIRSTIYRPINRLMNRLGGRERTGGNDSTIWKTPTPMPANSRST